MLILELNKVHSWKPGETMHLKIKDIKKAGVGRWRLIAEDVTPLPGAVTRYECDGCGIGVRAKEDGSLPDGWQVQKLEDGSNRFVCEFDDCRLGRYCRVCGCTEGDACIDGANLPCHWVEAPEGTNTGLCSGCAGAKEAEGNMRFTCQPR